MQALYQWQLTAQSYSELLNQYAQDDGFADADREYFEALLKGTTESSEALDALLESRGEELAVGIERAAAFLQSASRSAGGISRIFTTGGGARIPRLTKVLSDRLRIPVQLANPIEKLQVADGVFDTMPVDEVAPLLMLPIGLALRSAA